ncbi:MAG: alkaline phosphatase family protein [Terriglobia bacterium]
MMLSDRVNGRSLGRYLTVLLVLGLASLLPQAAWCASARTGESQWRAPKQAIQAAQGEVPAAAQDIKHVLLLTIDGAHPLDVENYIQSHPQSALAKIKAMGIWYNNAMAPVPSDSFPAMMAIITGAGPATAGIWYETSYHRDLSPQGSDCSKVGTDVALDETIDINKTDVWGGGGFNTAALPRNPKDNCSPVYPHQLLRVNTVFDVIKQAGMYTAFADKQLGDDADQGPTGHAIDDFYTPELHHWAQAHTIAAFEQVDEFRSKAVLNWINGKNGKGTESIPVPAIMGESFQAVSQGEKQAAGDGWTDASGTPSAALTQAFDHTDALIGQMLDELKANNLLSSTAIIVTAKHGQMPIDVSKLRKIDPKVMVDAVNAVSPGLVADSTGDDIFMFWLSDQSKTPEAVKALEAVQTQAHIRRIWSGTALKIMFDDPKTDPETPDIIVEPELGVIYTRPTNPTIAEHGGMSIEDRHVPILIANPRFEPNVVQTPVQTRQLAPTIVKLLGLDPQGLEGVRIDKTEALPGLF